MTTLRSKAIKHVSLSLDYKRDRSVAINFSPFGTLTGPHGLLWCLMSITKLGNCLNSLIFGSCCTISRLRILSQLKSELQKASRQAAGPNRDRPGLVLRVGLSALTSAQIPIAP